MFRVAGGPPFFGGYPPPAPPYGGGFHGGGGPPPRGPPPRGYGGRGGGGYHHHHHGLGGGSRYGPPSRYKIDPFNNVGDQRTTVMLKNVPRRHSLESLLDELSAPDPANALARQDFAEHFHTLECGHRPSQDLNSADRISAPVN